MHYFITGTDTGVGKTYFACLLLEALTAAGHRAAGFKPLCCGDRDDAVALHNAGDHRLFLDQVNPCHLNTSASPYAAALIENRKIDLKSIFETHLYLRRRYENLLIEGIGGWEVPITKGYSVADLAADLAAPVVVVVDNRLGALNHTILTVKSIRARGLTCAGLVLNHCRERKDDASLTNRRVLEETLGAPVLHELRHGETTIDSRLFILPS